MMLVKKESLSQRASEKTCAYSRMVEDEQKTLSYVFMYVMDTFVYIIICAKENTIKNPV